MTGKHKYVSFRVMQKRNDDFTRDQRVQELILTVRDSKDELVRYRAKALLNVFHAAYLGNSETQA